MGKGPYWARSAIGSRVALAAARHESSRLLREVRRGYPAEDLRPKRVSRTGCRVIASIDQIPTRPAYFIRLKWEQGRLMQIRDFYSCPTSREARFAKA